MSFSRVTRMSPLQYQVLEVARRHPPVVVWVRNMTGQAATFKYGSSPGSLFFAGPDLTTLAGTVTLTAGSPTVTGVGTAFNTALQVGDVVALADYKVLAKVAAIASPTVMTLDTGWGGATVAGATLLKVTPQAQTLAAFQSKRFDFPVLGSGLPVTHRYLYIENLNKAQLEYGIEYHDIDVRTIRDSLTEGTLA